MHVEKDLNLMIVIMINTWIKRLTLEILYFKDFGKLIINPLENTYQVFMK